MRKCDIGVAEQILNGTVNISAISYSQKCLLCENTRDSPEGMPYCKTTWVCDECKEAIAFMKDLKASIERQPSSDQRSPKIEIIPL